MLKPLPQLLLWHERSSILSSVEFGQVFLQVIIFALLKAMCLIEIAIINMHYVCTAFHRAFLKWRRT